MGLFTKVNEPNNSMYRFSHKKECLKKKNTQNMLMCIFSGKKIGSQK